MSLYSPILEKLLMPALYFSRGRLQPRRREFLESSQWWSRQDLLDFQWKELQKLLAHVFQSVPYYQKKYAAAGVRLEDIRSPADMARLPVLTREEVNAHRSELCSTNHGGRLRPHATGGSSGVPTRFFITAESYDWRMAATQRAYAWSGCRIGERSLYLWGAPIGRPSLQSRAKSRLTEIIQRQLIINTFSQTPESWKVVHERASRWKPELVVGYASSLEEFSRYMISNQLRLPTVKAVITAAEPLFEGTRLYIGMAFAAPVFNTYGSREFMSIGAECEQHQGLHLHVENLFVETALPPGNGPSEIIVTDLHNYGMPFVRYAIGDMGILTDTSCSCGRGLPLLKSVEGRVLDLFRASDGRIVPGEFFPHLIKDFPEVKEYQVRQVSSDHIVFTVVLSSDFSEKSMTLLRSEAQKVLGKGVQVEVNRVESIPKLPSGKRRVTIGF